MEIGASSEFRSPRLASQSWSPQGYAGSHTTDAVAGGGSYIVANGSVLSPRQAPPRPMRWNLYRAPWLTPGANPSQIPEWPRERRGCERGSHPLKSPITDTASAFGAHTAKYVPAVSPAERGWAPSRSASPAWVPSLNRYKSPP